MDGLHELLGIPDELEVPAVCPFSYLARSIGTGKKRRKLLSEIAHRGWPGQPFA